MNQEESWIMADSFCPKCRRLFEEETGELRCPFCDVALEPAPRSPRTKREWQEAVDLANFYLVLDSARQYGLIAGGPDIDVRRCEDLIVQGKHRGLEPRPDSLDRSLAAMLQQGKQG